MHDTVIFVNSAQTDKTSKRLMRSHVMKGKNKGKQFHRRSRADLQLAERQPNRYTRTMMVASTSQDSFVCSLPVVVSPASRNIINDFFSLTAERIYPAQLGISLHDAKLKWLPALFTDEATYHCHIALMQACNELYLSDGHGTPTALCHLSRTFSYIRRRLQSDVALSDSTIAIVVSLIMQEQIRHQQSAAAVHFKGLERMVRLRGGLAQLEGNLPLTLKICKTDIVFALQHGGSTVFFRNHIPELQKFLLSKVSYSSRNSNISRSEPSLLDQNLQKILSDILHICSLFNSSLHGFKIGLDTFQEIVVSLSYRLIQYHTLNDIRGNCGIQAAYHLGLTIFMMTTFVKHDSLRIIEYKLIPLHLRAILDGPLHDIADDFALWIMLIGGIWMSGDCDGEWLPPRIGCMAQKLNVDTWDDARSIIIKFPWINRLHDEPGRTLWGLAHTGRRY